MILNYTEGSTFAFLEKDKIYLYEKEILKLRPNHATSSVANG